MIGESLLRATSLSFETVARSIPSSGKAVDGSLLRGYNLSAHAQACLGRSSTYIVEGCEALTGGIRGIHRMEEALMSLRLWIARVRGSYLIC